MLEGVDGDDTTTPTPPIYLHVRDRIACATCTYTLSARRCTSVRVRHTPRGVVSVQYVALQETAFFSETGPAAPHCANAL